MASPGFDSIIPGLGRSILGGRRNKEPEPAAEAEVTPRSPRANERRSRSRGSSDIAEQARLLAEAENFQHRQPPNGLPYISPELRATLLRQTNEEHMSTSRSQDDPRTDTGFRPPNRPRGPGYQGRGPVASASRQSDFERKRRNDGGSGRPEKRPRGAESVRAGRYPPRAMLDRYMPGEDRDRDDGPSQPRQAPRWADHGRDQSIPRGPTSTRNDPSTQQSPSTQPGPYQHMHPDRIAISDRMDTQSSPAQPTVNRHATGNSNEQPRHTVFDDAGDAHAATQATRAAPQGASTESSNGQGSTAAGFLNALRGENHTAVEWNPDPSDTDMTDAGGNRDVRIKGEAPVEDALPESVEASAVEASELPTTEAASEDVANRTERLRFDFLEGLTSDEQISRMKGRMITLHCKAHRLERDLKKARTQLKSAKQARATADTARDIAIKAQKAAETRPAPASKQTAELWQRLEAAETAQEKAESAQSAAEATKDEADRGKKLAETEKRKAVKDLKQLQAELDDVKRELKAAAKTNKAASKAKDEAEETAQKALGEKERMAKRLEDLSSEHTLLIAETSNKEQLKKLQAELNQKSKEVVYLRNELAAAGSNEAGPSNDGPLSRKYEVAMKKNEEQSLELIEAHKSLIQKTEKIEKLKTRLAERGSASTSTSTPATPNDADSKKALRQQKRELKEAHSALESEKQGKRELKKKLTAGKTEIVKLEVLLKQEEKRRKGVERKLARELEVKGKLKERLARVKGEDDDEDEGEKDASSESEAESVEEEEEEDDDEGSGSESGDGSGEQSEQDSEDSSDDGSDDSEDDEDTAPRRSSSKAREGAKVKTEQRRSRSTSSQKATAVSKAGKSRSKSRARSASRRS